MMSLARTMLLAVSLCLGAPAFAQPTAPSRDMLRRPLPDTLSPEAKAASAALAGMTLPDPWPPIAAQRQFADAIQAGLGGQLEKRHGVRIEASWIAGVPVRIIYPRGVTTLGKGPVLLNLHGGGFTLDSGSLTETIPIAAITGLPVVAVLYRLAPEHPYPAALDDAQAVFQALAKDRPARRIAVFGTSAGAGLGAQLIARLKAQGRPLPAALGFLSGSADLTRAGDSEAWTPLPDNKPTLAASIAGYVGTTPLGDPILSPLKGDVSGFPPTLLLTSTRDFLLSGTANFARTLLEHGVSAQLVTFDGLPHAFWSYMDVPESNQANAIVGRFLKDHVTQ